jgi:hypothetical protein
MSFVKPVPYGNLDNKTTSKTMVFIGHPNDKVVSPYDGVVVESDDFNCDGFVKIEHLIKGKTFYSEICNVKNQIVFKGYRVKKNDIIGSVGNDGVIEYRISDDDGNFVKIGDFFNDSTKLTDDENINKEIDKQKDSKNKINLDLGLSKDKELPVLYRGAMNLFALPFSTVGSVFKGGKKKSKNDDEKINEDIVRIKKLINY